MTNTSRQKTISKYTIYQLWWKNETTRGFRQRRNLPQLCNSGTTAAVILAHFSLEKKEVW